MTFAYPSPPLRDGSLVLRPWDAARDLETVAAAATDPTIPATTSVPASCTESGARAWIERQDRRRQDGQGVVLAIAPDDGPAAGMVGVTGVDRFHGRGNLGYWVVPDRRSAGLAGRAARLLADWAFEGLDLVRLESRVAVDNTPSRRILEGIGFTAEGTAEAGLRLGERWVDVVVHARVRRTPPVPTTTWTAVQAGRG